MVGTQWIVGKERSILEVQPTVGVAAAAVVVAVAMLVVVRISSVPGAL